MLLLPRIIQLFHRVLRVSARHAYCNLSYSQEGEDLILRRMFEKQETGFYVDVGAHHPQRFSNTYHFYLGGWRGINIDAMPGSMKLFQQLRPRDINLEMAIASSRRVLTYYQFNEPALNGFDRQTAMDSANSPEYRIIAETPMQTHSLSEVLMQHLPRATKIDFLNIDVEGLEYEALRSNDWKTFRPIAVLVEERSTSLWSVCGSEITSFMLRQGYQLHARTPNTSIFNSAH